MAQDTAPRLDPAAIVKAFWEAAFAMRWADAVLFLDLSELEKMRRLHLEMSRVRPGREYTVEDLMLRDPDMPREAAEYEVRRKEKIRREYPERPFAIFGVDSASQLERMLPEELAARWLARHDVLWLLSEQSRTRQCPASPALDSLTTKRRAVVYGTVMGGVDTALVLFKAHWFPIPEYPAELREYESPQIAVLLRKPTGWQIRASDDFVRGSAAGMGISLTDCPGRKP
jgi:hypothetical protein